MSDQDKPAGEQDAVQKIMQHAMSHTGRFLNEFTVSEIINAALTVERDERAIVERSRDAWKAQVTELAKTLVAEREKYEAACEGRDQFKAQLSDSDKQLAAEREKAKLAKSTITQIPMFNENALRATIAEAQQPLVDALKDVRRSVTDLWDSNEGKRLSKIIDAALEKVTT